MRPIELIVYDFDGTLFDTRLDIANSVNLTLKQLGLPEQEPECIFTFIGDGVHTLMKRAFDGTGFDDVNFAVDTFRKIYYEHLVVHTDFYPHCRETVDSLYHKKQAIHSNKPECFVHGILDRFDFSHPFHTVIGGDTLGTRKPDPEGLFYILEQTDVSPKSALMVGDSSIDIETGKRAGVATCGVCYGIGGKESVAQADHLIDSITELKKLVD